MTLRSINPATGEILHAWPAMTWEAIAAILAASDRAQRDWRRSTLAARAALASGLAEVLRRAAETEALRMAREMGKPIAQGRAELEKCARMCDYYAAAGPALLADRPLPDPEARRYVHHAPLGVVLAIMPWNFPYWQALRCALPALLAGNAVVLKHAPNVSGCALAIEALCRAAGLPEGLFRAVLVDPAAVDEVTGAMLAHPAVRAVSLTGSTRAGRAVAAKAGALGKPCLLELGGSDPALVLADADLDAAAAACAEARLINSGQSCIAAKRFVVLEPVFEAFAERFQAALAAAHVGDPLDPATGVGPLARADLRETLDRQVRASLAAGARLRLGGALPEGPGFFYPVTLLEGVAPGMPAYAEEVFGPVAALIRARDEAEAIRIANDTAYGLGASVYTGDPARGERIAREALEAGACAVNGIVQSDPRLPFGGVKASGFGRELGPEGLLAFVNQKTICVL